MYFYNLEFYEEVEYKLCSTPARTLNGPFLMGGSFIHNKAHVWFPGTIYWLNPGRILKFTHTIPELQDREYAEWFPGEVFGEDITYTLATRSELILEDVNLYFAARGNHKNWGKTEEDNIKFEEFFKEINGYA